MEMEERGGERNLGDESAKGVGKGEDGWWGGEWWGGKQDGGQGGERRWIYVMIIIFCLR